MQADRHPHPPAAGAALAAYDVAGFTAALESAVTRLGDRAAETAAAALFAASGLAAGQLGPHGWRWVAGLGDGAVFAHDDPRAAAAAGFLLEELARRIADATGLAVRTATAAGPLQLVPVPRALGRDGGWLVLGAAAAELHRALGAAPVRGWSRIDPALVPVAPPGDLAAHAMQAVTGASIVVLVRLDPRLDPGPQTVTAIVGALDAIVAVAQAAGARAVRTGGDNKGVVVRLELSPDTPARRHDAVSLANHLTELLRRFGLEPLIALDAGVVFRAPGGAMRDGHGPAINAAAKALAAAPAGAGRAGDNSRDGKVVLMPDGFTGALPAGARLPVTPGALLGREADLERLLAAVRDGAGLLLIEGPAGGGKSAVLTELGVRLARRGHRIIRANVSPEGQLQPYRFLRQLLAAAAADPALVPRGAWAPNVLRQGGHDPTLADWILSDSPEGEAAARLAGRGRLEAALQALFHDIGSRGPVLALVDDMQFADRYSRQLAQRMGGRVGQLVAVGTLRGGSMPELERDLDGVFRHRLEPLDSASAAALISQTAQLSPPETERLARLSQGNPLVAIQTALAAAAADTGDGLSGPVSAHEALDLRMTGLDGLQRLVLRLVCLSPLAVDGPLLQVALTWVEAGAMGAGSTDPGQVAADLARQRLLEALPEGYQPVHQLVREFVSAQIPHAIRQALAGILATCLEQRLAGGRTGTGRDSWLPLGRLWRLAGPAGANRAADWMARAARSALNVGAADLAVQLLDEALASLAADPAARDDALIQLGAARVRALWAAGQAEPAARGAGQLLRQLPLWRAGRVEGETRAAVRGAAAVMAEAGQALGSPAAVLRGNLEALLRSLSPAGGGADGRADPRALAFAAAMLDTLGLAGAGGWLWNQARSAVSSPRQGAFVAGHEAMLAAARADLPRLTAAVERARTSLGSNPDRLAGGFLDAVEGLGLAFHGHSEEAGLRLRRLRDVARDTGNPRFAVWAAYGLAQAEAAAGQLQAALVRIRAVRSGQPVCDDRQLLGALAGLEARLLWQSGACDEAVSRAVLLVQGDQHFATSLAGLELFGGPALVLAAAVARGGAGGTRDLAGQAAARLRGAARLMPLAEPRARLVAALLAGQGAGGRHHARARQLAVARQLAPETALADAFWQPLRPGPGA